MSEAERRGDLERIAVIVPSLHPEPELLLPFLRSLLEAGLPHVIVVDDGSGPAYAEVFEQARALGCTVLTHAENQGKGRALKTGFQHAATMPGTLGVVTADSDGQHAPGDLVTVAERVLAVPPDHAVFGVRNFGGEHVPKNSRRGNTITRRVVRVLFGHDLSDTQTGLRGFPIKLALESAQVKGERFEYEMNVVLWLLGTHRPIDEVPIETIYHDITNSVSHFRTVRDSARIYAVIFQQFFKFVLSSLAGSVIDLAVYAAFINLVFHGSAAAVGVITSTVVARVVSSLVNFALNRNAVFRDHSNPRRAMARYYTLAVGLLALSAGGSALLAPVLHGHVVWAKMIIDAILFVASYLVQKRWVFADESLRNPG